MGDIIRYAAGPASVGAAGTFSFYYIHPPKGKASKLDLIQAAIATGTQTGKVAFYFGNDPDTGLREISRSSLTAAAPAHSLVDSLPVIYPGQCVRIAFSNVTAGDTVHCYIGGH